MLFQVYICVERAEHLLNEGVFIIKHTNRSLSLDYIIGSCVMCTCIIRGSGIISNTFNAINFAANSGSN